MAKSFGRNVALSVTSWAIPTLVALVSIPITVRGLGANAYGVVALAAAVTGYLGVLDVGIPNGVVRYMSMFAARRHGRAMRELLRFVVAWFAVAGALGTAIMWILAPWLAGTLLKVPPSLVQQSVVAFRLGGAAFGLGMIMAVLSLMPEAFLRYGLQSTLSGVIGSISLAGPAVLVMLHQGLVSVMWFSVAANGVACICWCIVALRLVADVPNAGPAFSEYRHGFVSFCKANAMNRVFSVIQSPTSRVIVGIAGGAAQAAYYSVPMAMSTKVLGLLLRMNVVLLPTGSQMAVEGQHERLLALYMRSARLFYVLNASLVCALVVFSDPLLRYWMGAQYADQGATALVLLALTAGLSAVAMTSGTLNQALGRSKVSLAFSLVNSAINLGTLYGLTVAFGISGTALSGLLAAGVVPFAVWYSHRKVLGIDSWQVFLHCYLRTTIAVVAVGAVSWVALRPLASGLPLTLGLTAAVGGACLLAAAGSGSVTAADWRSIRSMLRSASLPESAGVSVSPAGGGGLDG